MLCLGKSVIRACNYACLKAVRRTSTAARAKTRSSAVRYGISYYFQSDPPTASQLRYAVGFFKTGTPRLIDSAAKFRLIKKSSLPEVVFLGRSNVGKSSLLNALMGVPLCYTSSKPGRTKTMNFFVVGGDDKYGVPGQFALVDMPGYGKGSHEEWGDEIIKYLTSRQQLKNTYLLVDALHGLKASDEQLLSLLRQRHVPHQVILTKVDRLLFPGSKKPSLKNLTTMLPRLDKLCANTRSSSRPQIQGNKDMSADILSCSTEVSLGASDELGMECLRWSILTATGMSEELLPAVKPASTLSKIYEQLPVTVLEESP